MRKMSLKTVTAIAEIGAHAQEVRQGGDEDCRAQEPAVIGVRQEEKKPETGPSNGRHVVHTQENLADQYPLALTSPLRELVPELGKDQQATVRPAPTLHH
jgi:hypothetical protein